MAGRQRQRRLRVAVLISGGGSNLQALLDAAAADPAFPAEIVLVLSNNPGAGGLARAERAGVARAVVDHRAYPDREAFDAALDAALRGAGADLVCLAGFMRLLTPALVEAWRDRMLNIHPSLLPAFRGLHTHRRALAAGVRVHGCTVHLVRPELDEGPILVQGACRAAGRHGGGARRAGAGGRTRCYPLALRLVASGTGAGRGGEGSWWRMRRE
jgi:phosphoribosylglycinamide formyltransferase-1